MLLRRWKALPYVECVEFLLVIVLESRSYTLVVIHNAIRRPYLVFGSRMYIHLTYQELVCPAYDKNLTSKRNLSFGQMRDHRDQNGETI